MEFVFITNTVWNSPPRARHQLSYALAKNYHVTFVAANKFGFPSIEIIQETKSLQVIIPSFPISRRFRYRTPVLNESYQAWLLPQIKRLFSKKENVYIICTDFGGYLSSNYFDYVIYFASDDYINNIKAPQIVKAYTKYTQDKIVKTSKLALATAKTLVDGFRINNKHSYELPLGAPEFREYVKAEQILRVRDGQINVVLLGFIDKIKTPVPLINKILALGNTDLYLIGPIKDDILDLLSDPTRVHSLGVLSGDSLHKSLLTMDVAIAPYYMEDSNTGRTPNKMWQYLAAGKPAVITNLPNVQH